MLPSWALARDPAGYLGVHVWAMSVWPRARGPGSVDLCLSVPEKAEGGLHLHRRVSELRDNPALLLLTQVG